jgi:hypothetical protein
MPRYLSASPVAVGVTMFGRHVIIRVKAIRIMNIGRMESSNFRMMGCRHYIKVVALLIKEIQTTIRSREFMDKL